MAYKLSATGLNLFRECPRCFWLHHNKKIKRPAGIFPSLPSGMDLILKSHFDRFRDKGELPPELNELNGSIKLFDDVELLKVWRNNLRGIQWKDDKENLFRGAVDNILKKGKKLVVLDYKTRGFPLKEDTAEHYQDQLNMYNLLLRKNGYETEDYAYLLFYHPSEVNERGDVVFHTDLVKMEISIKEAERLMKDAVKCLGGEMPEAHDGCEFCKWVKVCNL
ncbi:PD-(D/E)XK nuclease family protein [Candidatus Pacearchaeota archaeon]|nr:PD-(D/E)XK nuclease family protein [Candidatus Pacearchaeota archaeon]